MDQAFTSMMAGLIGVYALLLVGMVGIYFFLTFFLGLMFYYFTGDKKHGDNLLASLMRTLGRIYTESWMFLSVFIIMIGLGLLFKVAIGAVFAGFVYAEKVSAKIWQADLQSGVIMTVIGLVVFLIHFGMNYLIQTAEEKRGTITSKLFVSTGLAISSILFFFTLFGFVMEIVSYAANGAKSSLGSRPGASLAVLLAALPVWAYYTVRMMMMVRKEKE